MIKKALLTLAISGLLIGSAQAATIITAPVGATWIRDSAQGPSTWGTAPVLHFTFTSNTTICGAVYNATTPFFVLSTTQLDNWARYASAAALAGRGLYIETYQPGGVSTCRVTGIGIAP